MTSRMLLPELRHLADRAAFEEVYLPPPGRHLRVNFVQSLDGVVEVEGTSGALGGPTDKDAFMALRAVADVVLAGAATVREENYGPVRLNPEVRERRRARGQAAVPPVAVVSASGVIDLKSRLFTESTEGPRPIVLTSQTAVTPALEEAADVITCGEKDVNLAVALGALDQRGLAHVLCEGGPGLAGHLLGAGLVDELCITISPLLAGPDHRGLSEIGSDEAIRLRLDGLIEGDGMLLARYAVLK